MLQNGACYIRVSTEDQTEYSPDAQRKSLKEYAKKNGIILTKEHIYMDAGISGRTAEKRPEFMRMIATAKAKPKPFDVILVHKFDRFARSREDSIVYKSLLKREAGIKVVSITESIEDDKFSVILEAMLEAMAEYYSLNLAEEVKKGMTEKAERGEIQTKAPFGYVIKNSKLVIEKTEAKLVKFIFEKFVSREMTMRQLAVYINDLGVKSKQGNAFENRSIDYILNNPVYAGKMRWTPTGRVRRDFNNPDTIIADGSHEPVISMELWNKAQEVIKLNKELYPKNKKTETKIYSWINGLVYCGNCGRSLVNISNRALQCNGYSKGQCKISCYVKISVLEEALLEEIKKTFTGPIEINIIPKQSIPTAVSEYQLLCEGMEKLKSRLSRIKIAYQDGIDTAEEYRLNKENINFEMQTLKQRLADLKAGQMIPEADEPTTVRFENAYELLTNPDIDIQTKYGAAHLLINKVTYIKQERVLELEYKY